MKKVLLMMGMMPLLIIGMDDSGIAQEAEKIAQEIAALRKPGDVKRAMAILKWKPLPSAMIGPEYSDIRSLCTSMYVPLMSRLLEKGIIKADAYCNQYYDNYSYTLLAEAIHNVIEDKCTDLGMVQLLLQKGASVNREGLCFHDSKLEINQRKHYYVTPLSKVTRDRSCWSKIPLIVLLLNHQADPNLVSQGNTPFMSMVKEYVFELEVNKQPTQQSAKLYSLIERCLNKHGASANIPSLTGERNKVSTPLQFAQEKQRTELVALFNQYAQRR